MWVEYHQEDNSNCMVCGHEINENDLCIGLPALPRGLLEQVFPFHPNKTNSRIINLGSIRLGEHVDWDSLEPITSEDLENGDLDPIEKNYIHLMRNGKSCFSPAIHRPFQCMFEYKSIEREDVSMVEGMIVDWQKLRKKMLSPQKKKRKSVDDEEESEESSPSPKRRFTRSQLKRAVVESSSSSENEEERSTTRLARRKKESKNEIKKEENSLLVSVIDDDNEQIVEKLEPTTEYSSYLLGLSDEIWCEILEYLNFDEYFKVSQVSKGMRYYSNLKVVWKSFICKYICPKAVQVQSNYFPHLENNYKEVFKKLYGNCCIVCGEYLRGDCELENSLSLAQSKGRITLPDQPGYYNFLVDNCVCTSCQSDPLVETISKTELKKLYNVSDSSNPFHRSTPMFKYLTSQAKALHQKKQEKALLLLHGKFKKLKISKGAYFALIQRAKRGHFGIDCLVYLALNGDKSNYKQKKLEQYINTLILSHLD